MTITGDALYLRFYRASALLESVVWGTLRRLRLTRLGAGDLLGGISLSQMAVAVVQVILVFGVALALGFNLAGHQIGIFDVFPATHGFLALQQMLTYGAGLREIAFRLGVTVALSLLYFALGVFAFRHLKLRART